jgi:hypothetical protein
MRFAILGMVLASVGPMQEAAAPTRVGLASALQGSYAGLKGMVTAEAAKMPEPDYGSKPSAMPEVRTFGQVIAHIAESQFDTCARVKSVPHPMRGRRLEQDLKTKADVTKALADSFAFCDEVFSATTDENALQPVRMQFGPRVVGLPRASVLYGLLAHTSEMYGIGTVYLRARGLVPPGSEPQGRGRGGL